MANIDAPTGLTPVRYKSGTPWNGQATMYCIPASDTNAYAIGDPLTLAGSADANGVATVVLATAGTGNVILGALVGGVGTKYGGAAGVSPSNLDTSVIPATKTRAYYVLVADDPMIVFEVQEDSVGNNLAATDVSNNFNLVAGTNNGYVSGWELDSSTAATTATLQVRVLGLSQRVDNAIGTNAKWLVLINNHCFRAGVAGV